MTKSLFEETFPEAAKDLQDTRAAGRKVRADASHLIREQRHKEAHDGLRMRFSAIPLELFTTEITLFGVLQPGVAAVKHNRALKSGIGSYETVIGRVFEPNAERFSHMGRILIGTSAQRALALPDVGVGTMFLLPSGQITAPGLQARTKDFAPIINEQDRDAQHRIDILTHAHGKRNTFNPVATMTGETVDNTPNPEARRDALSLVLEAAGVQLTGLRDSYDFRRIPLMHIPLPSGELVADIVS